ncbi:unnamed protein product [Symbiodinium pilosum]|uniref:Uncharacterized protein n=1 Tax=Symbiodinium pilosum TaxID=2952 RepID=A0A812YCB5_SYMPI|nr:unnamed protein product [Symbiodinium pilosum]
MNTCCWLPGHSGSVSCKTGLAVVTLPGHDTKHTPERSVELLMEEQVRHQGQKHQGMSQALRLLQACRSEMLAAEVVGLITFYWPFLMRGSLEKLAAMTTLNSQNAAA